jgi:GNAT superfamily N-acetyltransferase
VIGWFASGVIGWPFIKAGFDGGDPTSGVLRFVLVIFAGAIGAGAVGMTIGRGAGWVWQRVHERRRARAAVTASVAPATPATAAQRRAPKLPLPSLRFLDSALSAEAYLTLIHRVESGNHDAKRVAAALDRTINVTAWDGDRLVGVARIMSDGYLFAALADLVVDPDYQRRGLGSELMNRVFERTPRGALFVGAPLTSSGFFDHIGCDRGPTGFTMRRAARRTES